jgi:hypothetical protein
MLISVTISGIRPLILDAFSEEALLKGKGGKSTAQPKELSPLDQAKRRLYYNGDGTDVPIFPADNLLSCIIAAGRFIKVGKRQLTTRDSTTVTSFLQISELYLPIRSIDGWRVDSRSIVNPSTKGRHICYRPIFDDWELDFTLDIDTNEASDSLVRQLIDRAGRFIGIGVMRPERKRQYGQYVVRCWDCRSEHEELDNIPKLAKKTKTRSKELV